MIVASLGFFSSTAEAVILVTYDSNNPYEDTAYDPYGTDTHAFYEIIDIKEKKDVFLSTQATGSGGTTTITGYNDSSSEYVKDFTSITLEDAGSLVYKDDQRSVAFYLDINQTGTGSEQPYYEIHALEIYTSASAEFDYKNNAAELEGVAEVYKFDGAAGGNLRLEPENTTGTSNWDVAMYVPLVNFDRDDLTAAETYIHFVIKYDDNSGFDTWSVSTAGPQIPEPSSALLVALGGLMGLLRRRR